MHPLPFRYAMAKGYPKKSRNRFDPLLIDHLAIVMVDPDEPRLLLESNEVHVVSPPVDAPADSSALDDASITTSDLAMVMLPELLPLVVLPSPTDASKDKMDDSPLVQKLLIDMGMENVPLAMVMSEIRKHKKAKDAVKDKDLPNPTGLSPAKDSVICTSSGKELAWAKGKKNFHRGVRSSAKLGARGIPKRGVLNSGISFHEPELVDLGTLSSSSLSDDDGWEDMFLLEARKWASPSGLGSSSSPPSF
ncbi:uncharacterized protein LOC110007618 [Amborella trichopoda]|uniref:uncharacterized protein LOC110007618 n=1 Tax=Amborella trichopoda TaxID=13333 RepID=UPI0009C0BFDF|nr:uncharacterized protein LOC110007618 [Amborella trichopoda]|eukprot:XP_020525395.1 uncharacterized protein LOC110007618 [Amborella trichopoda]